MIVWMILWSSTNQSILAIDEQCFCNIFKESLLDDKTSVITSNKAQKTDSFEQLEFLMRPFKEVTTYRKYRLWKLSEFILFFSQWFSYLVLGL